MPLGGKFAPFGPLTLSHGNAVCYWFDFEVANYGATTSVPYKN